MLSRKGLLPGCFVALALLCACHGGGGSTDSPSLPRTNIDLTVTGFSVTPPAADPEDEITLTGTIQNLGTEMANPMPGDKFTLRFNLSKDGTFELREFGFLEVPIMDPLPAGGTLPFSYKTTYSGGDTFATYTVFCNSQDCIPPETGVIGVKVDGSDGINELNEGNNFQFMPLEVVGTRVAASSGSCDTGSLNSPGCFLSVSDPFATASLYRPCLNCNTTQILLPNELHRTIYVVVSIRGCTQPGVLCGTGWHIIATTTKPGQPESRREFRLVCNAVYPNPEAACPFSLEIRDPDY